MAPESGPPNVDTMAVIRTRLAYERTLMAWIRTAFSMITFGFTLFKFFQYLRESAALEIRATGAGTRNFGTALMILGTLSLVAAVWEYWHAMRRLVPGDAKAVWSLSLVVSLMIIAIGIFAAVSAVMNISWL